MAVPETVLDKIPHLPESPGVYLWRDPDGTVLYVLQGMRSDSGKISDVFAGVMPFMLIYIGAVFLLMAFPGIALWLPGFLSR